MENKTISGMSRRSFTKTAALAASAAILSRPLGSAGQNPKALKIGWIGVGSRGAADMQFCLEADDNTDLVAVADLFPNQVDQSLNRIRKKFGDRVKVTKDTTFIGFDGYKKILEMPEVDIVFLTTPPYFRPKMFREAIQAGKHCFVEKPGAVDPVGIRSLLETTELARKKNLSVVVGMQQRWMPQYQDIVKRVQDGAIGEIRQVGAYWIGTMMTWHWQPRESVKSDLEWQIRAWPQFTWLSGDCCVEQLVHNLDISNWVLGSLPLEVCALGGRIVRTGPKYGDVYDHFAFDFDYPGGLKGLGLNAQIEKIADKVCNTVSGSKGDAYVSRGAGYINTSKGRYEYRGSMNGDAPMHQAMCEGIRKGQPVNQGQILAEATMTGIIGRMSAYTGQPLKWKWAMEESKLDLSPRQELSFDKPFPVPPVQLPGAARPA
jgi:predicted dehydrogenase